MKEKVLVVKSITNKTKEKKDGSIDELLTVRMEGANECTYKLTIEGDPEDVQGLFEEIGFDAIAVGMAVRITIGPTGKKLTSFDEGGDEE